MGVLIMANGSRYRNCALFLLTIALFSYMLVFIITWHSARSHPQIYSLEARLASLELQEINHTIIDTETLHSTASFEVKPWNFTGSNDLNYPLEVDMPELVRRVLNNLSVDVEPINKPDFPILVSNSDRCEKISPDLLLLIKSAPANFAKRDTIRLTWGSEYCWGGRRVVHLFLLGNDPTLDTHKAARLAEELRIQKDLIQQDFIDQYHNNTYKVLFGIEWAVRYCPQVPLIMFVDDDFFVYPRNVIAFVEGLSVGVKERLFAGYAWNNAAPVRSKWPGRKKKWMVTVDEFPNRVYPPYVAGGNFFLSMKIAKELRIASWYTRYLRFDDVYLGILLKKLIRTPLHIPQIYAFDAINESSEQLHSMLSSHDYASPTAQLALWHRLDCSSFCTKPIT